MPFNCQSSRKGEKSTRWGRDEYFRSARPLVGTKRVKTEGEALIREERPIKHAERGSAKHDVVRGGGRAGAAGTCGCTVKLGEEGRWTSSVKKTRTQ